MTEMNIHSDNYLLFQSQNFQVRPNHFQINDET